MKMTLHEGGMRLWGIISIKYNVCVTFIFDDKRDKWRFYQVKHKSLQATLQGTCDQPSACHWVVDRET